MIAPAKLNLFLHVASPREDGLHELFSLVVFTKLGDEIVVGKSADLEFSIEGPFAKDLDIKDDSNSIRLAARALERWSSKNNLSSKGAALQLVKNLPVASGIGGGSSDAAAALLGLKRHWDLEIPEEQFQAIALSLGADVPVCLYRRPAWMKGIGERVESGPKIPALPAVLVNPQRAVSTRGVYLEFDAMGSEGSGITVDDLPAEFSTPNALFDYVGKHNNDLEAPAKRIEPMIDLVLDELTHSHSAISRMSGSGATCFGLYDDKENAEQAAAEIASNHPDWWVKHTLLLS